jgi:hypothetical protein
LNLSSGKIQFENINFFLGNGNYSTTTNSFSGNINLFGSFEDNTKTDEFITLQVQLKTNIIHKVTINSILELEAVPELVYDKPLLKNSKKSIGSTAVTDATINYMLTTEAEFKIVLDSSNIPVEYLNFEFDVTFIDNASQLSDLGIPLKLDKSEDTELSFEGIASVRILKVVIVGTGLFSKITTNRDLYNITRTNTKENVAYNLEYRDIKSEMINKSYTYQLNIPKGTDILKLAINVLQQVYTQNVFSDIRGSNLQFPVNIHINITQSRKIAEIIKNVLKINPLITYTIPMEKENQLISVPIHKMFLLPTDGLHVYLTSDSNKFPIRVNDARLNVEYI